MAPSSNRSLTTSPNADRAEDQPADGIERGDGEHHDLAISARNA